MKAQLKKPWQRFIACYGRIAAILIIAALALGTTICIAALDSNTAIEPETTTSTNVPTETIIHTQSNLTVAPVETLTPSTVVEWKPDPAEVEAIAKTLYGECRGVKSKAEQAAVVWCILNRVDSKGYPDTVIGVITQPHQFSGYDEDYPVWRELEELAADVLTRWHNEHEGDINVGRTLPKGYCFFIGDGERNYFTVEWKGKAYWNWSLENPYES